MLSNTPALIKKKKTKNTIFPRNASSPLVLYIIILFSLLRPLNQNLLHKWKWSSQICLLPSVIFSLRNSILALPTTFIVRTYKFAFPATISLRGSNTKILIFCQIVLFYYSPSAQLYVIRISFFTFSSK